MEVRHTVSRFPGAAFAAILVLVAALAVVMTLSIGGWGLAIGSPSNAAQPAVQAPPGSPATGTKPTTVAPGGTGQAPAEGGPSSCTWGPGCSSSP